ncbi:hypothetical protein TIFTF001_038048 [Ficus carica]|uniref:Uncharacterized protein n=1 Tax=Ficus carica TaxID=3494 RepID=A0AA88E851_FICCA|nr:hypothetical protein TIFTF001_038048 [Ficus carica]
MGVGVGFQDEGQGWVLGSQSRSRLCYWTGVGFHDGVGVGVSRWGLGSRSVSRQGSGVGVRFQNVAGSGSGFWTRVGFWDGSRGMVLGWWSKSGFGMGSGLGFGVGVEVKTRFQKGGRGRVSRQG